MVRKIIYLINPISGIRNKSSLKELIISENKKHKVQFDILSTNARGEYQPLKERIIKEGITDVVVCGGDGSVNAVALALIGTGINIGIIPMGSGNGLALCANIPKQTRQALQVVFTGRPSLIDGFYVNDQFSCMLSGIGFDASVAQEFAKEKKRGLKTYIKSSVKQYMWAKPYSFEIQSGERSFNTDAFFISIANSNQFGNNFVIAPHAKLNDGLLDIVIVKKMHKLVLPFSILRQFAGLNSTLHMEDELGSNNVTYFQTSSLTIFNKESAPLHIDGEPKETALKFEIKVVPNSIRLIQP